MGNPYLDAYRSSGGTGGAPSGGKSGGSNPYLSSYRVKQLPQVMADISTPKPAPQPKQQAPQQNQNWFEKGLAGVGKAFTTDLGKNVGDILGVGKSTFVDPAAKLYQQINAGQAVNNHQGGTPTVDQHLLDNQNTEIARALKVGEINQQKADQLHQKVSSAFTKTQQSYKQAQQDTGTKFNRDEGANALIDTVSNLGGVEGLIKGGVKVAAKAGTSLFDKMTGKTVAKDVIPKDVAAPIITQPAPKPSPTLFDKMKNPSDQKLLSSGETPTPQLTQGENQKLLPATSQTHDNLPRNVGDNFVMADKGTPGLPKITNRINAIDDQIHAVQQGEKGMTREGLNALKTEKAQLIDKAQKPFDFNAVDSVPKDANPGTTLFDKMKSKNVPTESLPKETVPVESSPKVPSEVAPPKDNVPVETAPVASDTKPLTETPVTDETPTGDTVSGNSTRIQQNALEKKLTQNMGDLAQYKSINMKDQAKQAVDLVNNDRQKALDIIDGKVNPPDGLHAQSVHQALEDVAVKEGNGQLLTQLAKSHINTELSEGAQKMRIAAERDPHSAVENIRQIQDVRLKAATNRGKVSVSNEVKTMKSKVEAGTPKVKKEDWASFIESLKC